MIRQQLSQKLLQKLSPQQIQLMKLISELPVTSLVAVAGENEIKALNELQHDDKLLIILRRLVYPVVTGDTLHCSLQGSYPLQHVFIIACNPHASQQYI